MPKLLTLDQHIGRHTFVAHCLGIGLMMPASGVNLVSHLRWRQAVIALDFLRMHPLALQLLLGQPVIEGDMGSISDKLVAQAVNALSIGTMLAKHLGCSLPVLEINSRAVQAPSYGPVIALWRLFFHLLPCLLGQWRWRKGT